MTDKTPGDLVRTLIRAVDDADQNAIAALTASDLGVVFLSNFYLPVLPIGVICVLYALYRASNENRWRI